MNEYTIEVVRKDKAWINIKARNANEALGQAQSLYDMCEIEYTEMDSDISIINRKPINTETPCLN